MDRLINLHATALRDTYIFFSFPIILFVVQKYNW